MKFRLPKTEFDDKNKKIYHRCKHIEYERSSWKDRLLVLHRDCIMCAFTFPCFWNVYCLGLASASIPQKHTYQSATSVLQPCSSVTSSAVDADCKTAVTEVVTSPQTPAAIDVVASMHSYAMPRNIGRTTNSIQRHVTVGAAPCEDHKASSNESEDADTIEHTVRKHCLCSVHVLLP